MRVPIIYYKVNRSVGPHRPHDYLEDRDMGNMEKLALKRLGWAVADLGVLLAVRKVRRHYGVQPTGRVPFPAAAGVVGVSTLVRHQQTANDRAYWYEKGRQDEAANFEAESEALREVVDQDQSNTRVIDAAGKTTEQVVAEAKAAMGDGEWVLKSVTPSKRQGTTN